MSKDSLIQFHINEDLLQEVSGIYDALGLDLETAFRIFLQKSKYAKGLPFDATLPDSSPEAVCDSNKQVTEENDYIPRGKFNRYLTKAFCRNNHEALEKIINTIAEELDFWEFDLDDIAFSAAYGACTEFYSNKILTNSTSIYDFCCKYAKRALLYQKNEVERHSFLICNDYIYQR